MRQPIRKSAAAAVRPIDDNSPNGSFDIILSAQTKDRDGDVLKSDEWKTPLPDHIALDIDHGMSVATTVGSGKPWIDADGNLRVKGTFASTQLGQDVRTLVNEGHVRTTSVAFLTEKNSKSGRPVRELLNGAFTPVPSNREAIVLSSKSAALDPNEQPETPGEAPDAEDLIETVVDLADQLPDADPAERPDLVQQLAQALADLATALNVEAEAEPPTSRAGKSLAADLEAKFLAADLEAQFAAFD